MLQSQNNFLDELVGIESTVKSILVNTEDNFEIKINHKFTFPITNREILSINIEILCSGLTFYTKMNKVFIHQIGKRIYNEKFGNNYLSLFYKWLDDFNADPDIFIQRIKQVFNSTLRT